MFHNRSCFLLLSAFFNRFIFSVRRFLWKTLKVRPMCVQGDFSLSRSRLQVERDWRWFVFPNSTENGLLRFPLDVRKY